MSRRVLDIYVTKDSGRVVMRQTGEGVVCQEDLGMGDIG